MADTRSAAGEGSEPQVPAQAEPAHELAKLIAESDAKGKGFWRRLRKPKAGTTPAGPPEMKSGTAPAAAPAESTEPVEASKPDPKDEPKPSTDKAAPVTPEDASTPESKTDSKSGSKTGEQADSESGSKTSPETDAESESKAGSESAEAKSEPGSEPEAGKSAAVVAEGNDSESGGPAGEASRAEESTDGASEETPAGEESADDASANRAESGDSTEDGGDEKAVAEEPAAEIAAADESGAEDQKVEPENERRSPVGVVYEPDESPDGFPLEYGDIIIGLPKPPETKKNQSKPTADETDPVQADADPTEAKPEDAKPEPEKAEAEGEHAEPEFEDAKPEPEKAEAEPEKAEAEPEKAEPEAERAEPESEDTKPEQAGAELEKAEAEPDHSEPEAEKAEAKDEGAEATPKGADAESGPDEVEGAEPEAVSSVDSADDGEPESADEPATEAVDDQVASAEADDDRPSDSERSTEATEESAAADEQPSGEGADEAAAADGQASEVEESDSADESSSDDAGGEQTAEEAVGEPTGDRESAGDGEPAGESGAAAASESAAESAEDEQVAASESAAEGAEDEQVAEGESAVEGAAAAEGEQAAEGEKTAAGEQSTEGEAAEDEQTAEGEQAAESEQAGEGEQAAEGDVVPAEGDSEAAGEPEVPEELDAAAAAAKLATEQAAMALITALMRLRGAVASSKLPIDVVGADEARQQQKSMLDQLDDYILPRLVQLEAPVLAVVGGSTGAGKSTLVNSLIGQVVSEPGVLRPTTRSPVLIHNPADAEWFTGDRVLPGMVRSSGEEPGGMEDAGQIRLVAADTVPPGLAILDAPDIDSVVEANRELATQLLAAADLWLFVTTAARYADAVPWEFLQSASDRSTAVAVVLDRAPADTIDDITGHLAQVLLERGLGDSPLFSVKETVVDGNGMLPAEAVASMKDWLIDLAADAEGRTAVVRRTLHGAVTAMTKKTPAFATAVRAQADTIVELRSNAEAAYELAVKDVAKATQDGTMLRGEVLARWQEFVGTGELLKGLQSNVGRMADKVFFAVVGKPPPTRDLNDAVESGLESLLREHAAAGAERAEASWQSMAAGRQLLATGDKDLGSMSEEFPAAAGRAVREWQGYVLDLVRTEGADKRSTARILAYGVNGLGLALMVVVFASTAEASGAEVGAGAGTAVVGQKLLEAVFGDQAVRTLAAKAREDLDGRVHALMDAEFARYLEVLDQHPVDPDAPRQLTEAARAVEDCT